jgi:ribulose kinase
MRRLGYDGRMSKNSGPAPFEVGCPHCNAVLKVDPVTKAVIAHTAAVTPKTFADFEAAAKAMKEQDSRRESLFRQSVEAQKNSADLLEKKFQEAVKKAKETPDTGKPLRDFDLD